MQPFVNLEFFGGKDSSMVRPVPLFTVVGRVLSSLLVQFKTVLRSDRMILLAMPPPIQSSKNLFVNEIRSHAGHDSPVIAQALRFALSSPTIPDADSSVVKTYLTFRACC